ncbi:5687_t:CDS:2 [Cetraspora pellucida]|uniref:5687_t:CDS:1 n=1 Tax=Cetraspora pellucida TaxID=1433469 RepID=A0A9N9G870_9GLOM|nr:5687_t:CDS:2 [Cetraspora pellucida]
MPAIPKLLGTPTEYKDIVDYLKSKKYLKPSMIPWQNVNLKDNEMSVYEISDNDQDNKMSVYEAHDNDYDNETPDNNKDDEMSEESNRDASETFTPNNVIEQHVLRVSKIHEVS